MQSKAIDRAPATAEPATIDGITLIGSAAANGIAPSEMKDRPIIKVVIPDLRSLSVKRLPKNMVQRAMAIGGTIPPAITAAITPNSPPASRPVPVT